MIKYFVGKVCTICTVQVNFKFREEQMIDYYMGKVESIDEFGVMLSHPQTKCKTYIFIKHIVSIAEEQVLYEENPEHAKIIDEYKKEKPSVAEKRSFIDIKSLTELAKKSSS